MLTSQELLDIIATEAVEASGDSLTLSQPDSHLPPIHIRSRLICREDGTLEWVEK